MNIVRSTPWDELIRNKSLAVVLGLVSHVLLMQGEPDHQGHIIFSVWMVAFGIATVTEYATDSRVNGIFQALAVSGLTATVYFAALLTSILLYRGLFHRLRKFPGPFLARFSKFYSLSLVLPDCQYYFQVEKLHEKYGDIVRTGPRELSIANADAISLIHGPTSRCTKGSWYDNSKAIEGSSLHTTRDKRDHKERRKIWERAFNAKSLREYEPRLNRHGRALIERLREHAAEPALRISNWINFYSFDIMGDVGFSRSFGMMEKGKEDILIEQLHKSMAPVSLLTHVYWPMSLLMRTVGVEDIMVFMRWTSQVLRERKKTQPKENDVFGWLIDPNDEDIPLHLNADTRLLVVAGSDTTAATLTWLFYELCKNLDVQKRLRKVVDDLAGEKAFLEVEDVANCPHLEGVINEALRLHPAVPSGVQRETPPEGLVLPNHVHIPGNTLVWMPMHTLQRNPAYFPDPLKFMPERWTDEASSTHLLDKRAFMPFITGPYNCIGQKLAMMEMKSVTANLVRAFEMRFADGENGESVEQDTKDVFTLNVGKLDVKLTLRSA
ncbi:cytochrome P450 [Lindgomyces ingoldianus]|uniref:Cytochrome P450 n=1 Tax=Lindgomyces ingoldianus TaxID=673940 RepID=A0ACB6QJ14_9PLEO|nr:cytochrome P450 [Lindgomyces ingoldianus]KAF2466583.1 cytochrome P450 [Lindgomyces ingoldianus]